MKIYIAGKITGDPDYYEKFCEAQDELEAQGCIVLNPALLPEGMSKEEYMRICFAMIDCADAVLLLPDWPKSSGATLEREYCRYIGKSMLFWENFVLGFRNADGAVSGERKGGRPKVAPTRGARGADYENKEMDGRWQTSMRRCLRGSSL